MKNDKEFFNLEDLKKEFSIKRIQKSGAVFDIKKLEWINSHYLRNMDINVIAKLAQPYFDDHNINISDKDIDNTGISFSNRGFALVFDDSLKKSLTNFISFNYCS